MYKKDVINYFGTKSELARQLGIKRQNITQWGDIIPEKHAFKLDRRTKKERHKLVYSSVYYLEGKQTWSGEK